MQARTPQSSRASGSDNYVVNLPPPWRRSLTESGMRAKPTRFDLIVVGCFLVVFPVLLVRLTLAFFGAAA